MDHRAPLHHDARDIQTSRTSYKLEGPQKSLWHPLKISMSQQRESVTKASSQPKPSWAGNRGRAKEHEKDPVPRVDPNAIMETHVSRVYMKTERAYHRTTIA